MTALDWQQWLAEHQDEEQRRLRRMVLVSAVLHVVFVSLLWLAPEPAPLILPQAITVDLVAALPPPPAAAPEPKPAPVPVAPPKPKVKILPKQAPAATAKPRVKPKPEPIVRRERPKELSYEDALAKLRGDLGETAPPVPAPEVAKAEVPAEAPVTPRPGAAKVAAWDLEVMRHIRANYITPPEFRDVGLATVLEIEIALDGSVIGKARVLQSSGNPKFDDNAVRAIARSSPLPPAPRAGKRTFVFKSEE